MEPLWGSVHLGIIWVGDFLQDFFKQASVSNPIMYSTFREGFIHVMIYAYQGMTLAPVGSPRQVISDPDK